MQRGAPRKSTNEDIALAMELLAEGCKLRYIAYAYSLTSRQLRDRIRNAEANGMR